MSKLEDKLAGQLATMTMAASRPWPAAEREIHVLWCCEHAKRAHDNPEECPRPLECALCEGQAAVHDFRRDRDFRCDFVWRELRLVVEVEGVVYRPKEGEGLGRHQQAQGFENDLAKYAALELAGWHVLRVGRRMVTSGEALRLIEHALQERQAAVDNHVDKAFVAGG